MGGGKPSKYIHCHFHFHGADQGQSSNCSCVCHSPLSTGSADYTRNGDDFDSLEQVTEALEKAGLESSNLIIGIDFTKSNEWTGKKSFMGRNLHHLGGDCPNPYEQAISIIGRTLQKFDDDNRIPCYGFGDATTGDRQVFSFHLEDSPCHGFEEVLSCYREIVPHVKLAGPTSFGPIIRNAIRIVNDSGGQYHILLIIADGQVTRSVDTAHGHFSPQEQSTIDAIVEASEYPLSIILVGVGDGPWDQMYECDDQILARKFDNFQFVNFTNIMSMAIPTSRKETEFALQSLMEIPPQYKATMSLQLLGQKKETEGQFPFPMPLPPPIANVSLNSSPSYRRTNSDMPTPPSGFAPSPSLNSSPSYRRTNSDMLTSPFGFAPSSPNSNIHTPPSGFAPSPSLNSSPSYRCTNSDMLTSPFGFAPSSPNSNIHTPPSGFAPSPPPSRRSPSSSSLSFRRICPVCFSKEIDLAFGCGHQTCSDCGKDLVFCPSCQTQIVTRIKLIN